MFFFKLFFFKLFKDWYHHQGASADPTHVVRPQINSTPFLRCVRSELIVGGGGIWDAPLIFYKSKIYKIIESDIQGNLNNILDAQVAIFLYL